MENYYAGSLNASRLLAVYQTNIERVKQYLDAEISFVRGGLSRHEEVLELGAGYGRVMKELLPFAGHVTGIDISEDSIRFGREYLKECQNWELICMDANQLAFESEFDVVLCLQNGLSAIKGDAAGLVEKSTAALKKGGMAYFSSYSPEFWEYRLAWFIEQAEKGLIGEIDMNLTKDGKIVCTDGFTATTYGPEDLKRLGEASACEYDIREVDRSSVFLIIRK